VLHLRRQRGQAFALVASIDVQRLAQPLVLGNRKKIAGAGVPAPV